MMRTLAAADEVSRRAPGVTRHRFEVPDRFDANERRLGGKRSIGDRAKRRTAVGAQRFTELSCSPRELGDGIVSRNRARTGDGVGVK